ncbi:sulfite exporter TauE/SafE family protein [Alteromonas sp. a30]|uniref:sulfite exporter TauE/SafE family protein n=1 Tax=Alteromonas sp. a30 TaxID=2730917 RepID=UPI00227F16E3|nr:sulfite exporter TauE/SafE family protein [Alteromonas sp. a30]MCY7296815.1 sulfite exporter TauE/SafE family protein [Alteromonas sp. a30]
MKLSSLTLVQWRILLFLCWLTVVIFFSAEPIALFLEYGAYAFVGVLAAIFANATGAGGGVVFVPFFSQLQFEQTTIVATSFGIQCFGMTSGSITWFSHYRKERQNDEKWSSLFNILLYTIPFSIIGLVAAQFLEFGAPQGLNMTFGVFSIILAFALYATIPILKSGSNRTQLTQLDKALLPIICLVGGVITAWLSVGVGELVAIYLIFRRFDAPFAIACAVILTAFSVWSGVMYHTFVSNHIFWPIVACAGLGAVIGGVIAKRVVLFFSATNLKLFFASWVLLSGIASIT